MSYNSNIPSPNLPLIGKDGHLSPAWFQFFITLFSRTGGVVGQDAGSLQIEVASGQAQIDTAPLVSLLMSVEALAMQALAVSQHARDERGEAGDGATLTGLAARLDHAESSVDQIRSDGVLLSRVADLEARLEAFGAPSPSPAGYDSALINGTTRTIAYY